MAKTTKLSHPDDPQASVEASPDFADMYRSQGWVEPSGNK